MMKIHQNGSIVSSCTICKSSSSTFEWRSNQKAFGFIEKDLISTFTRSEKNEYRLFRCAGCGSGAIGILRINNNLGYPEGILSLVNFFPKQLDSKKIPENVPLGITKEFREAEACFSNNCFRAASGLFRSVLDKTLRANGYKKNRSNLANQIDSAASDGVITQSRKIKAHSEIRVLGNDVLHDEWVELNEDDVLACWHYTQRILEDFYDDRDSVLDILRKSGRTPDEDKEVVNPDSN